MVIHKINLDNISSDVLPKGATILHVGLDPNGNPSLWYMFSPAKEQETETRKFVVVFTGKEFDATNKTFIGTFQAGHLICHVFEQSLSSLLSSDNNQS